MTPELRSRSRWHVAGVQPIEMACGGIHRVAISDSRIMDVNSETVAVIIRNMMVHEQTYQECRDAMLHRRKRQLATNKSAA